MTEVGYFVKQLHFQACVWIIAYAGIAPLIHLELA